MALTLKYAVRSDLGLVRNNNEDSVYAGPRLLAIADGMGGHAAGEVASKIVIGTMEHLDEDRRIDDLMGALRDTVAEATTALAEAVDAERSSRAWAPRSPRCASSAARSAWCTSATRAPTCCATACSARSRTTTPTSSTSSTRGKLTPDEAKDHPRKSVILRALLGTEVEPDVSIREARDGDRYLLCSDGLSDVVSTETILPTRSHRATRRSCADRLVELALRGGGPDNVTVHRRRRPRPVRRRRRPDHRRRGDRPGRADGFRPTSPATGPPGWRARARRPAAGAVGEARNAGGQRPVLALSLLAARIGGYVWTQTQYFVGRAGEEVAVFRGVDTEFGPVKLFTVVQVSDLRVAAIGPVGRGRCSMASPRATGVAVAILTVCPPSASHSARPPARYLASSPRRPATVTPRTARRAGRRRRAGSRPGRDQRPHVRRPDERRPGRARSSAAASTPSPSDLRHPGAACLGPGVGTRRGLPVSRLSRIATRRGTELLFVFAAA